MKLSYITAAVCATALVAAPAAVAKSFSGTVKGSGISAKYTIKNKGKKVCLTYGGSGSSNEPEEVTFSAKGKSFTPKNPTTSSCKKNKRFAKALKKANKVKANGSGPYPGEDIKGTLR